MTSRGLPPLFGAPWERGGDDAFYKVERAFQDVLEADDALQIKLQELLDAVDRNTGFVLDLEEKSKAQEKVSL